MLACNWLSIIIKPENETQTKRLSGNIGVEYIILFLCIAILVKLQKPSMDRFYSDKFDFAST